MLEQTEKGFVDSTAPYVEAIVPRISGRRCLPWVLQEKAADVLPVWSQTQMLGHLPPRSRSAVKQLHLPCHGTHDTPVRMSSRPPDRGQPYFQAQGKLPKAQIGFAEGTKHGRAMVRRPSQASRTQQKGQPQAIRTRSLGKVSGQSMTTSSETVPSHNGWS